MKWYIFLVSGGLGAVLNLFGAFGGVGERALWAAAFSLSIGMVGAGISAAVFDARRDRRLDEALGAFAARDAQRAAGDTSG